MAGKARQWYISIAFRAEADFLANPCCLPNGFCPKAAGSWIGSPEETLQAFSFQKSCLKAVDQATLRCPSNSAPSPSFYVFKRNSTFLCTQRNCYDVVTGMLIPREPCAETSIRNSVISAATQTVFALHSFLDPLRSKNASWWLLGNYC